jgi:hypothetical protein
MLVAYVCYNKKELPFELLEEYEHMLDNDNDYGDGRGVLVIEYNGKVLEHHTDNGEPEDNTFYRDYDWIDTAINTAYEMGVEDGKKGNY